MTGAFMRLNAAFYNHDKIRLLPTGNLIALWAVGTNMCVVNGTDGLLTAARVADAVHYSHADVEDPTRVVVSGLWHDQETVRRCAPCRDAVKVLPRRETRLALGELFVHDFLDYNLPAKGATDGLEQWRGARRRHLHHAKQGGLRQGVRDRDRELCRYCGERTVWGTGDRRSKLVGQYDHVDPFCHDGIGGFGNTLDNLVIACKGCNSDKGCRTPEQWGRALRPVPSYTPGVGHVGSEPERNQNGTSSELARSTDPAALAREASRSQVASSSELVPFATPEVVMNGSNGHAAAGVTQ